MLFLFRTLKKILKCYFYKIIYFNSFNIPIYKSYLSLKLTIINGNVKFGVNVKNKNELKVSVNGGSLEVGDNVFFNNDVSINCRANIRIGNNCLFGENICIYDHDHCYKNRSKKLIRGQGFQLSDVCIGNNVWIGSNSVILSGVVIGDNVVIAAGSIVKKNINSNSLFIQKRKSEIIY
ncbi:acyltransferase [Aliivibrio fischeri]|nr:acyltransferase [Aliivibrio fischeri]MUL19444.1 acyltransferase [Aliivibrio fischeri]MUL26411.1 acyltransferase [Aliivibrio fischeri]